MLLNVIWKTCTPVAVSKVNTIEKLGLNVQSIIWSGQSLHLVYLLEIRSGSPALAVGRPHPPHKAPARTASPHQLHLLPLPQAQLPPGQRVVVGQYEVPGAAAHYASYILCLVFGGHVRHNKLS